MAFTRACAQAVCGESLRVAAAPSADLLSEPEQANARTAIENIAIVNVGRPMEIPLENPVKNNVSFDDPENRWIA